MAPYRCSAPKSGLSATSNIAAIYSADEQMAANCIFRIKPACRNHLTKLSSNLSINEWLIGTVGS